MIKTVESAPDRAGRTDPGQRRALRQRELWDARLHEREKHKLGEDRRLPSGDPPATVLWGE